MALPPLELFSLRKELPCCRAALSVFAANPTAGSFTPVLVPSHIDHLVFRVPDLEPVQAFYAALLGPPAHLSEDSVMFLAGPTRIFFTRAMAVSDAPYTKESTGLNHLAFFVASRAQLEQIRSRLDEAGIHHSGIGKDRYGHCDYIWMDDPAGMRVEFYVRPDQTA